MNKKIMLLVCIIFFAGFAKAQVGMKIELNQKNYLAYENIYLPITFVNKRTAPLLFGSSEKHKAKLSFMIVDPDGIIIAPKKGKEVKFNYLVLETNKPETVILMPSKFYTIHKTGVHKIKAVLEHPSLMGGYESNELIFEIVNGVEYFKRTIGISSGKDTIRTKEIYYRLMSYFTGKDEVYAIIIEDKKNRYCTTKVAFKSGALEPMSRLDKENNLHLLFEMTPKEFIYAKFEASGKQLMRRLYKRVAPIGLVKDAAGNVFVEGGIFKNPKLKVDENLPFD